MYYPHGTSESVYKYLFPSETVLPVGVFPAHFSEVILNCLRLHVQTTTNQLSHLEPQDTNSSCSRGLMIPV